MTRRTSRLFRQAQKRRAPINLDNTKFASPTDIALAQAQRWRLLSDDDGYDYLVPAEKEKEFDAWLREAYDGGDPEGYLRFGCVSLGCSPTCLSFTDPKVD